MMFDILLRGDSGRTMPDSFLLFPCCYQTGASNHQIIPTHIESRWRIVVGQRRMSEQRVRTSVCHNCWHWKQSLTAARSSVYCTTSHANHCHIGFFLCLLCWALCRLKSTVNTPTCTLGSLDRFMVPALSDLWGICSFYFWEKNSSGSRSFLNLASMKVHIKLL